MNGLFQTVEEMCLAVLVFCQSRSRSNPVCLSADDPSTRTVGFSCFTTTNEDGLKDNFMEESSMCEVGLNKIVHKKNCQFWWEQMKSASERQQMGAKFMTTEGRKIFHDHIEQCDTCLPRYVMSV